MFQPIAAQVKVTYDDESMLVLALPEPIVIALQFCMEVYGNTRGDAQSDRNRPKRGGTTQNVIRRPSLILNAELCGGGAY